MSLILLLSAVTIVFLGSILQSAAGFAFGMFAIPLLILSGFSAYEAIAIISVCGTVQTIMGLYALRQHIQLKSAITVAATAALFLPPGVLLLSRIQLLEPMRIRQLFGVIVLAALLVQMIWRIKPRTYLHPAWGVVAGSLSGFMSGMSGMGGPPLVIWVMSHTWSTERTKATLWLIFTILTPIQIIMLYLRFGTLAFIAAGTGLALAPVVLLGMIPGMWLGKQIGKPLLRRISYIILLLISVYAIVQPYINIS
ncbi:MAG TPA: sulfite exporter TauE/SafE family protein [Phycisphaeraceae bacterium]|nr:sulfite exporter TauE/SafE family protein [Phycisphaeraceae bacterium]